MEKKTKKLEKQVEKHSVAWEMIRMQTKNNERQYKINVILLIMLALSIAGNIYLLSDIMKVDNSSIDIQDVQTVENSHIKIGDDKWEESQ